MSVKLLTIMEIQLIMDGNAKIIHDLQNETLKAHPQVVMTAIQHELQDRQNWYSDLFNERERRIIQSRTEVFRWNESDNFVKATWQIRTEGGGYFSARKDFMTLDGNAVMLIYISITGEVFALPNIDDNDALYYNIAQFARLSDDQQAELLTNPQEHYRYILQMLQDEVTGEDTGEKVYTALFGMLFSTSVKEQIKREVEELNNMD